MTIQSVRDGAIATVIANGKWTGCEISACDFGIAELTASSMIFQPGPNSQIIPLSFGTMGSACGARNKRRIWDIAGIVMVKDPGNPQALLGKMWQAVDDIDASFNDDTLNGTACAAHLTTISRPTIDSFISNGESDWGFIVFSLSAEEV